MDRRGRVHMGVGFATTNVDSNPAHLPSLPGVEVINLGYLASATLLDWSWRGILQCRYNIM